MEVHPFILVALSFVEAYALWKAWRKYKNIYLLFAFIRIILFLVVYSFIGFFNPPIEASRTLARTVFVFMQGITATAAVIWLGEQRGK